MPKGARRFESESPAATSSIDARRARVGAERSQGKGKGGHRLWAIVFALALTMLVASLVALGVIAFSYYQGQREYSRLAESISFPDDVEQGPLAGFSVNWDELRAVNPDVVAWVYIPGTSINYPVVRGADNEWYLTHDFEGSEGWLANYGAIFMDYRNAPGWSDDAYFIYGHHMNDGSMFADIAGLADQPRFDECDVVFLLSPQGDFKLRGFSLVHCDADDPLVQLSFSSAAEKDDYIQDKMARSVVDVGQAPDASEIGKVFAFATCDNFSAGRYVLFTRVEESTVEGLGI